MFGLLHLLTFLTLSATAKLVTKTTDLLLVLPESAKYGYVLFEVGDRSENDYRKCQKTAVNHSLIIDKYGDLILGKQLEQKPLSNELFCRIDGNQSILNVYYSVISLSSYFGFDSPVYHLYQNEHEPQYSQLDVEYFSTIKCLHSNNDEKTKHEPIVYDLVDHTSRTQLFGITYNSRIDDSIKLINMKTFDYDDIGENRKHILIIRATSSKTKIESYAKLIVHILNQNENSPRLQQEQFLSFVQFNLKDDQQSNSIIGQIKAYDLDENDHFEYQFVTNQTNGNTTGPFSINSQTGEIQIINRNLLDFNVLFYHLYVIIIDESMNKSPIIDVYIYLPRNKQHKQSSSMETTIRESNGKSIHRHRRQQQSQPAPSRLQLRFNESFTGILYHIKYCRKQTNEDYIEKTFTFPQKYEQYLNERLTVDNDGQLIILKRFNYEYFQSVNFQFHCLITERQQMTRVNKSEEIYIQIDDVNDELPKWIMDEPYQFGTYYGYVEKTARPETPVFRFKAQDVDTQSRLTYEIEEILPKSVASQQLFHISQDGTLTTHSNQQLSGTYNITVKAIDVNTNPLYNYNRFIRTYLLVSTDRVDPKFYQQKYVFNVSEYTQPSTIVGSIKAKSYSTTQDNLRYFLQPVISIHSDNYEFKIDETIGTIKILKLLRYSDQHNNNTKHFHGIVKELNGWQLDARVDIEIHIIDINDKTPTFKQTYYTPQISEDYPLNTPIINFTVTDDDARNSQNSNITLDLVDSYGKFSIYYDPISTPNNIQAYLIAKERLDYESLSPLDRQYKLRIIARDNGQPKSLQSEAQIYITVTDVNDEPPIFKDNPIQKTIAENTQKGTTIVFVDVHDTEYNDSVTVQFQTQQNNPFRIITSPGGGRVILDGQLQEEFYNLTILAYDRLNHTSQAQLLITVYDVNDHTPEIENCQQGIITSKVKENATINTPILKINATDKDRGLNGEILFSLKGGGGSGANGENDGSNSGTESDLFAIDSETGLIYNKKRLKHLKSGYSEYTMTVFAQDKDPQNPRSTHCIIKINVEDINDHYPIITSPSRDNDLISIKVEKRINYLNYAVLTIRAKDDDSGKNAQLSFSIKSKPECATSETHFTIDSSSGIISIRPSKLGDIFQTQNKYCLVIQVCDQGDDPKCVERKVNFQLSQDGFEPPVWAPETALTFQRVMKVVELAQQNIVIDTFKASISNDSTKKVIFEMEPVDWKCHNSPITNEAPRIPFLLAPDENGRNIARLVIYQPIDADPPTGCTHFTFKIKAKNSAMEALSVESLYKIEIIDSNDNIPIFNVSSYRAQIYENEVKENILRVQADDKDIDPKNRNTTYFIRCQNNAGGSQSSQVSYYSNNPVSNSLSCQGIVSIDPETGWISVQRQFDFDNPNDRRYVFDVFAKNILPSDRCNSNNKESQQQQQANGADSNPTIQICVTEHRVPVIIEVLDRNDNAPVFQGQPYLTNVSEDAEPGTTIFQLNVSDVDTDDILTFNIVNVQEASAFAVKENTGEVYLASGLDYERVQQHRVIIQVSDSNNEHTNQAELTVIVEDANDNPPRFLNLPATIEIEEGKQVVDYDQLMKQQQQNGNSYSDENYESPLYRRLKRRRRRRATNSRKYNKQNEAKPSLRKPTKPTENTLYDVDRYRATSSSSNSYQRSNEYNSRVIYTVKAEDPDKGRPASVGGIKFTLTSSNQQYTDYFEIHPTNGTIHLKKELDRDPPNGFDEWLLTIIAADEGGLEGSKKNASWLKIMVKDINDNPPIFIDVDPIGHIAENAKKDTRVEGLRIRATDYDKLSENTTRYALTLNTKSIDGQDVFRIDELTSDIYLNVDNYLDREKTPHHNLSIIARDIGDPAGNLQSKELKITIIIDDVNDQPPRFKPTHIQAQISEIAQRGDFVSEIKAEDDDVGVNTHSIYEIIEECQLPGEQQQQRQTTMIRCSKPKHFIFKETSLAEKGTIILLEPVNYDPPDNQTKFLLKVKATNGGMFDYANVTVFITDFNDNTPVFSQSVYFVNISESTPLNSEILQVSATDNDVMPVNKEFIFRIPPDRQQYENRQHLRMDTLNGKIYLKKNFDREKSSTISLPLEAVNNQSTNVLIGRAVLVLNILDVNDNFPKFAENYQPRIREHEQPKKILEFRATDPDEQTSPMNFEFKLGSKNVWPEDGEPKFRLDVTSDSFGPIGVLSTLKVLDREELCPVVTKKGKPYCGKYYDLPIWMNDNSKPQTQSGINYLRVIVEDVNDNPHHSGQKQINAYDYKQQLIKAINSLGSNGLYIGTVYSKDEDDWDMHTKEFELLTSSSEFFRVDKGGKTSKTPGAIYMITPTTNNTSQLKQGTHIFTVSVLDTYTQWLQRDAQKSTVEFHLNDLSSEAVENAASIRLQDITAEEFIETRHMPAGQSYYKEFARLIGDILNVRNVEIFSIQDHENIPRTIDVYYAVHGSGYLSKVKINGLVNMRREQLEDLFNISQIGINECLTSDQQCFEKGCISRSEIVTKQPYYVINGNETAFIGLHIRSKAQCQCETDIQYQLDKELQEQKLNRYCLNGGYPQRDYNIMKCSCPHGTLYNGERCQLTTVSFDDNGGYGWYKPLSTCSHWLLQLDFLTQSPNGILLYNGPLNNQSNQDYFSLQLVNGHPSIELNFGTKAVKRYLKSSSYLADGKWHTIEIRQLSTIDHILEIIIDYCPQQLKTNECRFMIEYAEDDIFSTNEPLQLGGVANKEKLPIDYAGNFKGCIRNLRFADELYDLHVDSHSGQSLNLHEGCLLVDQKCSQLTCVHGTCEADLYQAQCVCKPGKSGATCSQDAQSYDFTYDKMTWTGDRASYATFRHTHKPDDYIHAMKFQIMFRTRDLSERILTLIDFHNDDTFMFLELKAGHLQARFGSKSDTQLIELRHVQVNDGRWHTAYLDRYGQRLFLKLDDGEYYRSNISYGKSIWKNFPNTLLNVGARIDSAVHKIVTADFNDGCIQDVRYNGQLLDLLNGSSSSDMKWTFQSNIKEGCDNLDNWCRGVQCLHPAFCVNTWRHGICSCPPDLKYFQSNDTCVKYDWCFDVTNPCYMPGTRRCYYEAKIDQIECECLDGYQGERCTQHALPISGTFNWHILILSMICLFIILALIFGLIAFTKRRQAKKAYILGMDDEIRDNIINYDEEGCPDEDPITYDISTLKKPIYESNAANGRLGGSSRNDSETRSGRMNSESEVKPLLSKTVTDSGGTDPPIVSTKKVIRKDIPPLIKPLPQKGMTNGDGQRTINVGDFIKNRIKDIDDDPSQPPYDSLQEYAFEGTGEDKCFSLSTLSLTSKDNLDSEQDMEFDYLNGWGPKFHKLADLYISKNDVS